jgi:ribosomal protein S12 methylthiotransferase
MTFYLDSLGCAKNLVESEKIISAFEKHGHSLTPDPLLADTIIVNTCGFIGDAREESVDTLFEYSTLKENGKLKTLILTGCLAQMSKEELKKEFTEVDYVLDFDEVIEFLLNPGEERNSINLISRHLTTPSGQAYLKIAEGCSQGCAFCTIPTFKGPFKSFNEDDILSEAFFLAQCGVKELNLVAQDLTSYGLDAYSSLPVLLKKLCGIDDIKRIRLLYTFPDKITDELIKVISNEEKICNYIDIPLQHLDDNILKRMNRWGSYGKYKELIFKLRENIPEIALRTTMIVGFPGEGEDEYNNLYNRCEELMFDRLGVFEYSDEPDTKAFLLDKKVKAKIKKQRLNKLMALQLEISSELLQKRVGKCYDILIEEIAGDNTRMGRSQYEAPEVDGLIFIDSSQACVGDIVKARIVSSGEHDLFAEEV